MPDHLGDMGSTALQSRRSLSNLLSRLLKATLDLARAYLVIPSLTALADGRFLRHIELVDDPAELDFDVAFDHFYNLVC